MTTYLTPHFSLDEFFASATAKAKGIDNAPPGPVIPILTDTAWRMENVRMLLGGPVLISSGYRCPALNAAVGGVSNSAHLTGHAVDFTCPAFGDPSKIVTSFLGTTLPFDQLIEEGTWVHISFAPTMRRQSLKARGGEYTPMSA